VNHPLRKVVIPAAGLGTRFLPATKAVPKEMLPIVDTPTIQLIVEEALRAGAQEVVLVNGRGKGAIEDHFDRAYELESELRNKGKKDLFEQVRRISDAVRLVSVRQKEPLGLGHAVLAARNAVGDEWFGVMLGDDLVDAEEPAIGQLVRLCQKTGKAAVALMPVPESQVHLYGIGAGKPIEGGHIVVDRIVEKPKRAEAPSNLAVIGRYVLPPDIFHVLSNLKPGAGGEIQLTDGLAVLAKEGRLLGVRFTGTRYDAGDRLGYLQANVAYALKRPDLREGLLAYLRELSTQAGSAGGAKAEALK
jgi:UTP--glucose-1-phosphate uridylyltransferase